MQIRSRVKMEMSWEVLQVPPEIEHSTAQQNTTTEETTSTEDPLDKSKKQSATPKLCGFLNKQGEKGLIKTWKTRWFVYDERRCRLYYYRTPQDCVPLGSIDLGNATFSFEVDPTAERLNKFDICTPARDYHLQAKDKQTMMFWLQELQTRRREYSKRRTHMAVQKREDVTSVLFPTEGLIGEDANNAEETDDSEAPEVQHKVMQVVPPPETVGEEAALKSPSGGGMFNISFNNIKTEFRNMSAKRFSWNPAQTAGVNFSSQFHEEDAKKERETKQQQGVPSGTSIPPPSQPAPSNSVTPNATEKTSTLKRIMSAKSGSSDTSQFKCQECEKLRSALDTAEGHLVSAREEINVRQEVILNLHEVLRRFQLEKGDSLQGDPKKLEEELESKTDYISKLELQIGQLEKDKEKLQRQKDKELCELMEQIQMYREMTAVKDQVVVSLTNQLHNLEVGVEEHPESPTRPDAEGPLEHSVEDIEAMSHMRESLQAYQLQNRFLNSEILELNRLRLDDDERLRALTIKLATAEAETCKYKSKYFLVLRELQRPKDSDSGGQEPDIIEQLVQDAMDSESADTATLSRTVIAPHDRWGFVQRLESNDEEAFLSMAHQLDRRSGEIKTNSESQDISNGVKWENYMMAHKNRDFQKTMELKSMVRGGIPNEYRSQIWRQCINHFVRGTKSMAGPNYYAHLLDSIASNIKFSPATKQIELDLLRTLPNNVHYNKPDANGIGMLRNVLMAYSWHNPEVGYCQGLNRLVAIAMLILKEEEAFWCLVAIVEHIMPKDYFSRTLLAAQADQRVLRDLLMEKLPRLYTHFENVRVDLSLITFNWFLTVFIDSFPIQTILRVWDTFLYEGNKVLFRYALAVFKMNEEELLKIEDHAGIFNYMRQVPERIGDHNLLSQIAFQGLNPFPMQKIRTKRNFYLGVVKGELEELDRLRNDYVNSRNEEDVLSEGED
ncbi:TBC1 domain family member 2B isoform X2 [Nematostella vectensis]|uniref:TBC1 domain family member 2B isoform X2 n=1 Tax=Nematostella vectensis TaxID=45351 RepID=UPI002076FABD|nr:TBC1 domain family member 2B isoform X2 [Nematostella vectensis]